jgi:hypothetical protein
MRTMTLSGTVACTLLVLACGHDFDIQGTDPGVDPPTRRPIVEPAPPVGGGGTFGRAGAPSGPEFTAPAQRAPALPVAGGTLLVTRDGTTAVAADPDRNSIFLVDLSNDMVRTVAATPGDALGRVVEGPAGTVFVAARHGGAVLVVDLATATVKSRLPLCNAPSGLAFDTTSNKLWVTCRSGTVLSVDAANGSVLSRVTVDDDLRDIVLVNGAPVVTRFRSAEVLQLTAEGTVSDRTTPASVVGGEPAVAHRAVPVGGTMLLLATQEESNGELSEGERDAYGGECVGEGIVEQVLSLVQVGNDDRVAAPGLNGNVKVSKTLGASSRAIVGAMGPVDVAVSASADRVAIVGTGNAWNTGIDAPTLFVASLDVASGSPPMAVDIDPCLPSSEATRQPHGEPVAVAFDHAGQYVVQSREPAQLELENGAVIALSTESHFDTGFALFHTNTGVGISCVSCHPDGSEDGHTWHFAGFGPRRTQALQGGVDERAPFHWNGDLTTFDALFNEVMMTRMSLPTRPTDDIVQALAGWLDTIPAFAPADDLDPTLVARGKVLFSDPKIACVTCHSGPSYSDNQIHDVGTGGEFVTPSLNGVGLRAPVMHDGCATTLRQRFGACGGTAHGVTSSLTSADIDALVAFMRSL